MKTLINWIIGLLIAGSSIALAGSGWWYDSDNPGHGLTISQDGGHGHGVIWYLYRADGSAGFVVGVENCQDFPCVVTLAEPVSAGAFGQTQLKTVGWLELTPTDSGLKATYDLVDFLDCRELSPGGIIFRKCIGTINLKKLAQ